MHTHTDTYTHTHYLTSPTPQLRSQVSLLTHHFELLWAKPLARFTFSLLGDLIYSLGFKYHYMLLTRMYVQLPLEFYVDLFIQSLT